MKKSIACAAIGLAMAGGAFAQGVQVKGLVGMGFTFGGDTLANVRYDPNSNTYGDDNAKVHAGGLIAFHGGVEVQFTNLVSAQALIGYHFDKVSGENGSVRFERYPVELLGHFRLNDWVRLGGGARYTGGATLRASGAGTGYAANTDYKPTYGSVVEGEFFVTRSFGIKLRYVSEKFKAKSITNPNTQKANVDGSHGGIYFNYYFP